MDVLKFESGKTKLETLPINIEPRDIMSAMRPFLGGETDLKDPKWNQLIEEKVRETKRRLLKRRFLGWLPNLKRGQTEIEAEYSAAWARKGFRKYRIPEKPNGGEPWVWRDRALFVSNAGGARGRLLVLMKVIEHLKPRSVLEVGFGNGLNLLPLACRFPEIQFSGIELTEGGFLTAKSSQEQAELPEVMREFAPFELKNLSAHRDIDFKRGSAAKMPYADGAFDLVFSSLALEQMEEIREEALSEFSRVSRSHVCMFEPFRESNDTGLPRDYIVAWSYFQGRVADLPRYGMEPVFASDDFPAETWLRPCLVLCRKK